MKVLVTGFNPFGGESVNSALKAVELLGNKIADAEIIKVEIPTVFRKSVEAIESAIIMHKPQIVILVGQAGGRSDIAIERVAINLDDARIRDNENNQPIDEVIYSDGKNAYFSSLPVKAVMASLKENGIPSAISNTAGTFVCNHVFYSLMYLIEKKYNNIRGGFIHVPFLPEQVVNLLNVSSMSLETIKNGMEIIIESTINHKDDVRSVGGSIY